MAKKTKQTKSKMLESAELAQALMRCPGLGIYIVQDGKFQYANALFQELTGYTEQELRSIHPLDLVHPEDRELVREKAIENLKGRSVLPYEYRFIKKNGEIMCNLERLASIEYMGRQAAVGSFMDVTDSKRAEKALVEEATRWRILMDQSRDGISVLDENGKVHDANQQFAEMLGYSLEEVRELHAWDWDAQWGREHILGMIRTVDETGDHFETCHRRKDGTVFDVEMSTNGAIIAGKKLIFCVSRDITERRKAEEAIRRSEQNFRDSIENSPLGIRVLDKDGKTLYANRALLDMWGYSSIGELEAVPKKQRYTPQAYAEHVERFGKRKQGERASFTYETSIVRSDGQVRHVSASRGELLWAGEECFQVVYQDITEQKQAEEALRRSEQNFHDSIEKSPLGIRVLDKDGKTLYANRMLLNLWGFSSFEEMEAVPEDERYTPESYAEHMERTEKAKRGESVLPSYETSIVRIDGEVVLLSASRGELLWGGKECFQVVYQDITERKEAEESLRRSEQNFRDSIENSPLGIRVISKDGKHLYANRALLDLWGYSSVEEMEAVPREQRYTPESYAEHMETLAKRKRGEPAPLIYELSIVRSDGQVRHLSMSRGELLWNGEQQFQIVYQDVTERKQAEQNFRDSIENSPLGMHVIDKDGKHLYTNRALLDIWGYSSVEELEAVPREQRYTPKSYAEHMDRLAKRSRGEPAPTTYELGIVRSDGEIRHLSVSRGELMWNGELRFQVVYQDITERKQAEQNFRDSIENSPLGMHVIDKDGKHLYTNRALLDIWGYSSVEELEAVPREQRYTPESYAEHMDRLAKRSRGEPAPLSYELGIVRSDGEIRHLSVSRGELMWNGELRFQVVYQDVTERKQAEQALADEAMRRRILMDQSRDGISILDEDSKVVEANQRFAEMMGYTPEEVRELHTWDWDTQWTREELLEMGHNVDEAGVRLETQHRRKDGTVFDVDISVNSVMVAGKKLLYCVSRDITERKQAEEALRRSEENFRDSIENSPLGIRILDKDGKTLYANRALLDTWGYSSVEELDAVPRKQRYTPQTYAEHLQRLEKRRRGEPAPLSYDVGIVRSDGEVRILSVSRGELLWNGEKQFQIVSQDITEYKQLQEALAKSEERYRSVLEQMEEAYFEVDIAGNYTFVNDAMCRQSGYSREELIGMNYRVYTPEDEVPRVYRAFNRVYETGRPIKGVPMGRIRKGGTRISTETSAFPLRNESGELIGFRGITRDVSERAQMIEALTESEERYRTILAEIQEGYYEVGLAGNFIFVNDAICRQLGYSREELIGMNYKAYVPKEEIKGIYKAWNKVFRTGKPLQSYPFTAIRKDKKQVFLEASISPSRNKEGKIIGFRSVSRDVTERAQYEQKLTQMATHDALTGLPNRMLLSDRFTVALALSRRTRSKLAVLMLDLDRFKAVNDSMGHDVGDKLLKAVGKRLKETVRKSDTVARIGGDEFVLVLPQIPHADEAATFAQRILDAFRKPFVFDDHRINITTSIGIAVYPGAGKDIESLLKSADTAMYWAKEQGRDIYRFYDGSEAATLLAKRRTTA